MKMKADESRLFYLKVTRLKKIGDIYDYYDIY